MSGQIKRIIDTIVEKRAKGNPAIESTTKTKLTLKGINPNHYTADSPDDPEVIQRLHAIAGDMGVTL